MSQGRDRLFEAEVRANLREREQKTIKKLDETLSKLEEHIVEDVELLEPKERVSLYAKLIKYVVTPAANESRGARASKNDEMSNMDHLSIFGNVLNAARSSEA